VSCFGLSKSLKRACSEKQIFSEKSFQVGRNLHATRTRASRVKFILPCELPIVANEGDVQIC